MKHTPGPWEAYETPGRWNVCHKSEGHIGGTFAEIRALHVTREARTIAEANARLIAVSPEMLEALTKLDAVLDFGSVATENDAGPLVCSWNNPLALIEACIAARAAITKATGE